MNFESPKSGNEDRNATKYLILKMFYAVPAGAKAVVEAQDWNILRYLPPRLPWDNVPFLFGIGRAELTVI